MIVLGIDTATSATAVALRLHDGTLHERRDDPPFGAHPGHATRLLAMLEELSSAAGIGFEQIELIAVGRGPGTFTGLRVGVATAAGLTRSLGVSSLSALAAGALEDAGNDQVLATIDARRGEVFAAVYQAGRREPLVPPRALPPSEIGQLVASGGSSPAPLAVGDGAVRYREQLGDAGVEVPPDSSPLHLLRAGAICGLALEQESQDSTGPVLPDYLRRPDAELALERAQKSEACAT